MSGTLHVYVSQTDRGELVFGRERGPVHRPTRCAARWSSSRRLAAHVLELMPALPSVRLLRQWAGLCDMTPGLLADHGRDPGGGLPASTSAGAPTASRPARSPGRRWRELVATGETPEIIAAFGLGRFERGRAGRREGRGRRGPLMLERSDADPPVPLVRPARRRASSATPASPSPGRTRRRPPRSSGATTCTSKRNPAAGPPRPGTTGWAAAGSSSVERHTETNESGARRVGSPTGDDPMRLRAASRAR